MTCTHVLGLIDAGPLADYPRAHLDAARQHARDCATCGRALRAATALTEDLSRLAQPAPPPDLAAAVLARVARTEQAGPTPGGRVTTGTVALANSREGSAWAATAAGGLMAGLTLVLSMAAAAVGAADATVGFLRMTAARITMPQNNAEGLALAVGLLVYVAGLFAGAHGREPISERPKT